jgi:hypothetical protein
MTINLDSEPWSGTRHGIDTRSGVHIYM